MHASRCPRPHAHLQPTRTCPQATRPYSVTMPNRFNFAFDSYFLALFVLAAYLPGFYRSLCRACPLVC